MTNPNQTSEIKELFLQQARDRRSRKVKPIIINPTLRRKIVDMTIPEFLICCSKVFKCIQVKDVAEHLNVTPRAVHKRFKSMMLKNKILL